MTSQYYPSMPSGTHPHMGLTILLPDQLNVSPTTPKHSLKQTRGGDSRHSPCASVQWSKPLSPTKIMPARGEKGGNIDSMTGVARTSDGYWQSSCNNIVGGEGVTILSAESTKHVITPHRFAESYCHMYPRSSSRRFPSTHVSQAARRRNEALQVSLRHLLPSYATKNQTAERSSNIKVDKNAVEPTLQSENVPSEAIVTCAGATTNEEDDITLDLAFPESDAEESVEDAIKIIAGAEHATSSITIAPPPADGAESLPENTVDEGGEDSITPNKRDIASSVSANVTTEASEQLQEYEDSINGLHEVVEDAAEAKATFKTIFVANSNGVDKVEMGTAQIDVEGDNPPSSQTATPAYNIARLTPVPGSGVLNHSAIAAVPQLGEQEDDELEEGEIADVEDEVDQLEAEDPPKFRAELDVGIVFEPEIHAFNEHQVPVHDDDVFDEEPEDPHPFNQIQEPVREADSDDEVVCVGEKFANIPVYAMTTVVKSENGEAMEEHDVIDISSDSDDDGLAEILARVDIPDEHWQSCSYSNQDPQASTSRLAAPESDSDSDLDDIFGDKHAPASDDESRATEPEASDSDDLVRDGNSSSSPTAFLPETLHSATVQYRDREVASGSHQTKEKGKRKADSIEPSTESDNEGRQRKRTRRSRVDVPYKTIQDWSKRLAMIYRKRKAAFEEGAAVRNVCAQELAELLKEIDAHKWIITDEDINNSRLAKYIKHVALSCNPDVEGGSRRMAGGILDCIAQRFLGNRFYLPSS